MTTARTESVLGPIPKSWTTRRLEELSDFITKGGTPTTYGFDWSSQTDGIPFFRSECVTDNGFNPKGMNYIHKQAHLLMSRSEIKPGDLLITITGNIGRVAIAPSEFESANINQHIARIRILDNADASASFVYHCLKHDGYATYYRSILTGQAYPQISLQQVRETPIALPPLTEQQKIAAILTAVDDKLDVIARQIEATQTLKQGLMQTLFSRGVGTQDANGRWMPHTEFKDSELGKIPVGWEIHPIGYATRIVNGNAFKSSDFSESGIPVIRISNIKPDFSVNLMGGVFFAEDEKLRRFKVESGDMLIAMSGATTGKVGRYKGEGFCYLNQRVGRFEVDKARLSPDFLFHFLRKSSTQDLLLGAAAGGAQPNISAGSIEAIQLSFPPVFEQHRIAEILNSIDTKQDTIQKKRRLLGILKRGLMQKLLTGEWRVNVDTNASGS